MRPRRYVLVTHSHYPDDPRAVKHATALHEAGYEAIVMALRRAGEARRETLGGVAVRRLPLEHKRGGGIRYLFEYAAIFLLASWELAILTLSRRPALVQVNSPPDFLIFAALFPKLFGAKLVLDLHEPMPELLASIQSLDADAPRVRLLKWIERASTRFADAVVTVSEICRQRFASRGTPAAKITVVKNVSDLRLFDAARFAMAAGRPDASAEGREEARASARANAAPDAGANAAPRLIYHGTLVHRYGVDVAVRALARVRETLPGATLAVYGRGEEQDALTRLARELGVAGHVVFGGQVDLPSIPEKIARADIGVVPNRRDIFMDLVLPTKLFEYIAMERPAVVAATAAVLEHFGRDDLYLFEPGDDEGLARAVLEANADPVAARARARRLRERCARETWADEREILLGLYERLTGRREAAR